MKTVVPNYYNNFKCIADKCKHNCCVSWEIDIDDETLNTYKSIKGKFSRKLKNGIEYNDNFACFKLDGKGRCVFLNKNNLCDIIKNFGENYLCQICADHPRFRNLFSDRTEIGLGLCCEEVGRIILGHKEPFSLITISDNEMSDKLTIDEKNILKTREKIFEILNQKDITLDKKINEILQYSCNSLPRLSVSQWANVFLSLERLDDYWTVLLNSLKDYETLDVEIPNCYDYAFENLLIYFTYRHLNSNDNKIVPFIIISYYIISLMCKMHIMKNGKITFEDIIDYARLYSSEIEYSDENINVLFDIL